MNEEQFVVDIALALLELNGLSPDELARVARKRGWEVSKNVDGIWEMGERYPVVLDCLVQPPMVVCPFLGADELPRSERRRELRSAYEESLASLTRALGIPTKRVVWSPDAWMVAICEGERVLMSMEETDYEAETPFLVLACVEKRDGEALPTKGLTARVFRKASAIDV